MKYFLCKRCGVVFSEEDIEKAGGVCPKCFADGSVLLPCTETGRLIQGDTGGK